MSSGSSSDDSSASSERAEPGDAPKKKQVDSQITSFFVPKKLPPEKPSSKRSNQSNEGGEDSEDSDDSDYDGDGSKNSDSESESETEDDGSGDGVAAANMPRLGDPAFEAVTPENRSFILSRGRLGISALRTTFPTTYYKAGRERKGYKFQPVRLQEHNWLEYSASKDGCYCFECRAAGIYKSNFTTGGFKNWKNVNEKLAKHSSSAAHKASVEANRYDYNGNFHFAFVVLL
jgi:hypothetical protein